MERIKHLNVPLIAGILILFLLLTAAIMPWAYTRLNPYATESMKVSTDAGGNFTFVTPPFPPDDFNVLGSDEMGRDVWSLLIYGVRLTIGIGCAVAFFRFLLGFLVGLPAAYGQRFAMNIIHQSNIVFNFVPPLIICILVLKIQYFESLPKALSFWVFVFVLTLVGWARIAEHVQGRASELLREDFIRSEISIGKRPVSIAIKNVLPHMAAETVVLFFMEMAVVLGLMMQLGAFNVFIGNLRIVADSGEFGYSTLPMSFEPEWSAMMGASRMYLRAAPWLVLSPAVAFFVSILGFNLVGEGLRNAVQRQHAKLLPHMKRHRVAYVLTVVILITGMLGVNTLQKTTYAAEMPETLAQDQGEVIDMLNQYGFMPIQDRWDNPYTQETYRAVTRATCTVDGRKGVYQQTFSVVNAAESTGKAPILDFRQVDLLSGEIPENPEGKAVVLSFDWYSPEAVWTYIEHLESLQPAAVIVHTSKPFQAVSQADVDVPLLQIEKEWTLEQGMEFEWSVASKVYEGDGINIAAILNKDKEMVNDDAIVIALPYAYDQPHRMRVIHLVASALGSVADELDRRVILLLYDGHPDSFDNGITAYLDKPYYAPKDTPLFLSVNIMSEQGSLSYSDAHAPFSRTLSWTAARQMERLAGDRRLYNDKRLPLLQPDVYDRGIPSILLRLEPSDGEWTDENVVRLVLDAVIESDY